jgi:MinD-like ATPase involved in chromosome partitioning or flagellar assembly
MSALLVTFYSFKGGVGRTQALANVAVALARRGLRIIAVDMDLESPGLHRFFGPEIGRTWTDAELAGSEHRGVLEYFEEVIQLPDDEPRLAFLPCAHGQLEPGSGSIRLLLPGRLDQTYPERVSALSFDELYRTFEGYEFVEAFRRQLVEADADFVLVDSRTGITDVAGVCTFQLPDIVIAMFALHRQGIEGVHQVARAIERARASFAGDSRRREILLVPARVDETGESEKRDEWVREAQLRMRDVGAKLLGEWNQRIPYESRVAFGEEIVIGLAQSHLTEAYENLTKQILSLAGHAPPSEEGAAPAESLVLTREAARRIERYASELLRLAGQLGRELEVIENELAPRLHELDLALPDWLGQRGEVPDAWRTLARDGERLMNESWAKWRDGWHARFRAQLEEAAEGESALVESVIDEIGAALKRGALDEARELCQRHTEEFRRATSRTALLRLDQLTLERLSRSLPERDTRVQWLENQLASAVDHAGGEEMEPTSAIIRNCLRLLLDERASGEPAGVTIYKPTFGSAYDVLCAHLSGLAQEHDFAAIGAPLWRAAWHAYFTQGTPRPADDLLPTGTHVRAELQNLAARSELPEPLITEIRDGIARAWRAWGARREALAALFKHRHDDPALRAALAGRLVERLTAVETRAILGLWLENAGFDAGVFAHYLRVLVDDGYRAEAFFACEAARQRDHAVPDDVRAAVVLRFALRAAQEDPGTLRALLGQPAMRSALEQTRPGLLLVVLVAAGLVPSTRISAEARQELNRHLLYENEAVLPEPIMHWLRWVEQHPRWESSESARWAALQAELEQVMSEFPAPKEWIPSRFYAEEFRSYWRDWARALTSAQAPAAEPAAFADWYRQARQGADNQGFRSPEPLGWLKARMETAFSDASRCAAAMLALRGQHGIIGLAPLVEGARHQDAARRAVQAELDATPDPDIEELRALMAVTAVGPAADAAGGEAAITPVEAWPMLRLPLLLVRFDGPDPWQQYLDDLLQWSIGARDWTAAARDYIRAGRFTLAARAILNMAPGAEQAEARDQLERVWKQWYTDLRLRAVRIEGDAARLHAQQGDPVMLEDARTHARAVTDALQPYEDVRADDAGLDALASVSEHAFADCERRLDEADAALVLAQEDLQERRQRALVRLKELKQQIDAITTEFLLDAAHGDQVDAWTRHANQLLRAQDPAGLERLLGDLRRVQAGEIAEPDLPAIPASPHPQPASPLLLRPRDVGHQPALSYLAGDLLMAAPPRERGDEPDLHLDDFSPGREWSRGKLDAIIARCLRNLHPLPASERYGRQDMGCLLVAQAQAYLLAGEFLEARALFADALSWVTWQRREQGMRELSVRLWHEPCAWGFTLAFLLPYLGGQERARVLNRSNLGALFLHPFGELPLDIMAHHELLGAYARQMHMLDAEAGVELLRYFVHPYLREHPVAEQEFAAGLLRGQSDPAVLSRYLEVLLQAIIPDVEPRLRSLVRDLPEAATRERRAALFLVALRAWLSEPAQSSGLALALAEAAEQVGSEPVRAAAETDTLIASSLMTRELALPAGAPARLVLAVTGQDAIAPLYELRADVSLLDENERQIPDALDTPPLVDRLRAGERREIPVPVLIAPADAQRVRRVQVRYSIAGPQGQWQYLKTAHQSYAVAIQPDAARTEPDAFMPYLVGRPVDRRDGIFGRDDKIDEIFTYLEGRDQDNAVLVLGDRRIGKTTLLHAVKEDPRRARRYPLWVKIDQQDIDHRPQIFFGRLIREIQAVLATHGLPRHSHEKREIDRDPAHTFRTFMAAVDGVLVARDLRMLVILDELEKVYAQVFKRDQRGRPVSALPSEVIASLRSVIQDSRRTSFLLAGVTDGVRPYLQTPEGRLFQMAHIVELEPLDRKASRELIERPAASHYDVAPPAAEHLVSQTGGQPYLLQQIGAELFRYMRRRRARLVSVVDVDEVLEQRILPNTAFFTYLTAPWRERERFSLLKALAHLQSRDQWIVVSDIARRLASAGVLWKPEEITAELDALCEQMHTVIRRNQRRSRLEFRLEIGLLARHIRWLDRPGLDLVLRS